MAVENVIEVGHTRHGIGVPARGAALDGESDCTDGTEPLPPMGFARGPSARDRAPRCLNKAPLPSPWSGLWNAALASQVLVFPTTAGSLGPFSIPPPDLLTPLDQVGNHDVWLSSQVTSVGVLLVKGAQARVPYSRCVDRSSRRRAHALNSSYWRLGRQTRLRAQCGVTVRTSCLKGCMGWLRCLRRHLIKSGFVPCSCSMTRSTRFLASVSDP